MLGTKKTILKSLKLAGIILEMNFIAILKMELSFKLKILALFSQLNLKKI